MYLSMCVMYLCMILSIFYFDNINNYIKIDLFFY